MAQSSLFTILQQGGITMVPLAICSIIALAVAIERFIWGPRTARVMPEQLRRDVKALMQERKLDEIAGLCRAQNVPLARIILTAIRNAHRPRHELVDALELVGRREAQLLQRGLAILSTVAAISPLLGLLGTVFGMIQTFSVISQHGVGNANLLSGGISEALISTAAGLTIAIPTLVLYRYFLHRADQLTLRMEEEALRLVDDMQAIQPEKKTVHGS